MRLRHALAPSLLGLALALTGCGSGSPKAEPPATTQSPTQVSSQGSGGAAGTSTPAAGPRYSGTGYTFNSPAGWRDATAAAKKLNSLVDLAVADTNSAGGFATNVNVVVAGSGSGVPSAAQMTQFSDAIKTQLRGLVPDLVINPQTTVAGQPALDHEGAATKSGVDYYIHQFVAFRAGKAYTITFSFGRSLDEAARQKVIGPVLASWSWR